MAQTGFTPILIYSSGTAGNAPAAANLINSASGSELALNYADGKLYYKDSAGVVRVLADVNTAGGGVTSVAVASANGLAGTSSGGNTPTLTLSTTVVGLMKGNGTAISAAISGTDYAPATSGTNILYGNGAGGFSSVTIGSGLTFSAGTLSATGGGGGTVTAVSVASANGFAGTSSGGATPALTLSTTVTGMVKGNGTAISAAVAGTDYAPATVVSATAPTSPITGTLWLNTTTGNLEVYNGTAWASSLNLSSPPPIGNVTPNTGAFSTLGVGTAAPTTPFELISTSTGTARFVSNDSSTVNQRITFYKNSTTPAASAGVAILEFLGNDSALAPALYARLRTTINTTTAGAQTGNFFIEVPTAGVTNTVLQTDGNLTQLADSTFQISSANQTAAIGGTAGTVTKFAVTGLGTTTATTALRVNDNSGQPMFRIRDDGLITTGTLAQAQAGAPYNQAAGTATPKVLYVTSGGVFQSQDAFNTTTATAANAVAQTNGCIARSTSSIKYKRDVEDFVPGLAEALQLRPVTYKGKNPDDGEKLWGGLIAEEVAAIPGLMPFVMQAEDGSPDALAYGNMVALLVNAIKELTARVVALEAK